MKYIIAPTVGLLFVWTLAYPGMRDTILANVSKADLVFEGTVFDKGTCGGENCIESELTSQAVEYRQLKFLKGIRRDDRIVVHHTLRAELLGTDKCCLDSKVFAIGKRVIVFAMHDGSENGFYKGIGSDDEVIESNPRWERFIGHLGKECDETPQSDNVYRTITPGAKISDRLRGYPAIKLWNERGDRSQLSRNFLREIIGSGYSPLVRSIELSPDQSAGMVEVFNGDNRSRIVIVFMGTHCPPILLSGIGAKLTSNIHESLDAGSKSGVWLDERRVAYLDGEEDGYLSRVYIQDLRTNAIETIELPEIPLHLECKDGKLRYENEGGSVLELDTVCAEGAVLSGLISRPSLNSDDDLTPREVLGNSPGFWGARVAPHG